MDILNYAKIMYINEREIDVYQIIRMVGTNRSKAASILSGDAHIPIQEAREIMNDVYDGLSEEPNISFKEKIKAKKEYEQIKMKHNPPSTYKTEKQLEKEHLKELDAQGIPYCPKCHSTSLSANKKGFGIGKAVAGGAAGVFLTGNPLGLLGATAGNVGAKKVRVTCLKCGHEFWAGDK